MSKVEVNKQIPRLDLHGAFVRRIDLSRTRLKQANLAGADATNAVFKEADFEGARLDGTILSGADLTGAKNLTMEQLSRAIFDADTRFPTYIDRRKLEELAELQPRLTDAGG